MDGYFYKIIYASVCFFNERIVKTLLNQILTSKHLFSTALFHARMNSLFRVMSKVFLLELLCRILLFLKRQDCLLFFQKR